MCEFQCYFYLVLQKSVCSLCIMELVLRHTMRSKPYKSIYNGKIQRMTFGTGMQKMSDDMPVQMENPFKRQPERCTLCGVPVEYKNVQLLSQFVSPMTGMHYPMKATSMLVLHANDLHQVYAEQILILCAKISGVLLMATIVCFSMLM